MKETTNRLHTLLVIYYVLLGGFVWFFWFENCQIVQNV